MWHVKKESRENVRRDSLLRFLKNAGIKKNLKIVLNMFYYNKLKNKVSFTEFLYYTNRIIMSFI